LNDLKDFKETENAYPFGEYHHAVMKDDFNEQALKNYLQKGNRELEIKRTEANIEDCFMALMAAPQKVNEQQQKN
jgi:hypothetical protein